MQGEPARPPSLFSAACGLRAGSGVAGSRCFCLPVLPKITALRQKTHPRRSPPLLGLGWVYTEVVVGIFALKEGRQRVMGKVWTPRFVQKKKSGWGGFAGMSLSPITSALLGVTSAFPQSPNAVELGRISSCSWVIWILPCLAAVHLAEVGSEHPFPSGCHAAFSSQEEFCVVKTPHTSHPGDEHWLDWGETEADVELRCACF